MFSSHRRPLKGTGESEAALCFIESLLENHLGFTQAWLAVSGEQFKAVIRLRRQSQARVLRGESRGSSRNPQVGGKVVKKMKVGRFSLSCASVRDEHSEPWSCIIHTLIEIGGLSKWHGSKIKDLEHFKSVSYQMNVQFILSRGV